MFNANQTHSLSSFIAKKDTERQYAYRSFIMKNNRYQDITSGYYPYYYHYSPPLPPTIAPCVPLPICI